MKNKTKIRHIYKLNYNHRNERTLCGLKVRTRDIGLYDVPVVRVDENDKFCLTCCKLYNEFAKNK